tara:strand:+ start:685 stop:1026 length:342 start_codon:yes stop_codon:yes gene_type:complete
MEKDIPHDIWSHMVLDDINSAIDFSKSKFNDLEIERMVTFHSGGGCLHLMFHLSDKKVLIFHHTDEAEISYDKWESIEDYFNASDDGEFGFGWENMSPNYDDRCYKFDFEKLR